MMYRMYMILATFGLCFCNTLNADLVVVNDGKANMKIVLPTVPSSYEQQAADEMSTYLSKMTGVKLVIENNEKVTGSSFVIGSIDRGKAMGVDVGKVPPGGFLVRTVGDNVYLLGNGDIEPLYAVYWFLENVAGIRWFNNIREEYVPQQRQFTLSDLDHIDTPAFVVRDVYTPTPGIINGYDARNRYYLRNRVNGPESVHENAKFRCYYQSGCHTLYSYIKPELYFDKHPEYYSLRNGERTYKNQGQLCFSNPGLRKLFIERVLATMSEVKASKGPNNIFSISAMDTPGCFCECKDCQALVAKYQTEGGPLFDFLAELAPVVKEKFPDFWLQTLAYRRHQSEAPPQGLKIPDNLIVVFAPVDNDLAQSIDRAANRETYDNLMKWSKICKNLWVWYYPEPYGDVALLPFDGLHNFVRDMRIFHRLGVSGIFLENDAANLSFHDLCDLKQWVMEKILWNPNADLDELIKDFTEKYYGPAGKSIQKYYYALHQAAEAHSSHIYLSPSRQAYSYLTPEFLQKANKIFDQAEESVAGNETYLHRVQCARLSLYRAQIIFADELNPGTDVKPLIEKYRKVYSDTIHRRIAPTNYSSFTDGLDKFIDHQLSFNTKTTTKPSFPGTVPAKVRDYTARDFSVTESKSNFVDSKAVSGLAVKLTIGEKNLVLGVNDRNSCKNTLDANIPIDKLADEYQLIKIGQSQVGDNSVLWMTMGWSMTCELCGLEQPGLYDVYVSIRSLRPGEIAIDRVVLVPKSVSTSGKKIR